MAEEGVEFTGRTVDDAVEAAESTLGADRDDLVIEVLSPGSRGVFGIGAENARVLARRQYPTSNDVRTVDQGLAVEEEAYDIDDEAPEPVASQYGPELPEDASVVLRELLEKMGFQAQVAIRSEENPVILEITGDNLGALIGRRGDNLSALQFMVNLILSKGHRQWPRVVIDVEHYRARREDSLRSLAERTAYRVQRNGRPFTLEAMPASDRRVIHISLRERTGIETYSIGEGPARRVVIAPKRDERGSAP